MNTTTKVKLVRTDMCDACNSARAMTVVKKDDLELYLCGHHDAKHGPALALEGWEHLDVEVEDPPK